MRVVVFFIYLTFLLFRGDMLVYAATHPAGNAAAHHHGKPPKVKFTNHNIPVIDDTEAAAAEEFVITDDECDEDEANDFLAEKFRLLARCYATIAYDSILTYDHKCFKAPPAIYCQESDIYLLQRTLRI